MAVTEIFTGTVTSADWHDGPIVDFYGITLHTDDGLIELRGSDRLNAFPQAGQRIRVAAKATPKGHYKIACLSREIDPGTAQPVQIEVL